MKISAVILTHDSASTLDRCLQSLIWCDEIIVIDDYSTDATLQIAKKYSARGYRRHLNNDWSAQRNFALKLARHDWLFYVDSDEVVPASLKKEIISLTHRRYGTFGNGYLLRRQDIFLGRPLRHGETASVRLLRLANRRCGSWQRAVHEIWAIRGPVGELSAPLLHCRRLSITEFIDRLNQYTSLETPDFRYLDLTKPKLKFIQNYFLRLGFLDGFPGFIMAYLMSLNSLIVRVKSWENSR